VNVSLALADHLAKGCNAACARGLAALVRALVRVTWGYLHYWTLAIVVPLGIAGAWLGLRDDD
jgi:uncharacterized membrane protein YfcA